MAKKPIKPLIRALAEGELKGELATLLAFAQSASHKRKPGSIEPGCTESLVAGARNHLYRTVTSGRKQAR